MSLLTIPSCHPQRKHYAKGFCNSCYHRAPHMIQKTRAMKRKWYHKHRVRINKYARVWGIKKRYGISLEAYNLLFCLQRGGCAICGGTGRKRLAVDHDHETGAVRGLLCGACNTAIGKLGKNLFDSAKRYLEQPTLEVI